MKRHTHEELNLEGWSLYRRHIILRARLKKKISGNDKEFR